MWTCQGEGKAETSWVTRFARKGHHTTGDRGRKRQAKAGKGLSVEGRVRKLHRGTDIKERALLKERA